MSSYDKVLNAYDSFLHGVLVAVALVIGVFGVVLAIGLPIYAALMHNNWWLLFTYFVSWVPGFIMVGVAVGLIDIANEEYNRVKK